MTQLLPYDEAFSQRGFKPTTHVSVNFLGRELRGTARWSAVLDTGSPYTILPGRVGEHRFNPAEVVRVELLHGDLSWEPDDGMAISVPVRGGASARFGGVGAPMRDHMGFTAYLEIPGLFENFEVVYFEDLDHAIIGTPILFRKKGMDFRRSGYRLA